MSRPRVEHGFGGYRRGCRCEICRTTTATYQREYRAKARARRDLAQRDGKRYVAQGIRHSLSGYQSHACRCVVCRSANAASAASYRARRAS